MATDIGNHIFCIVRELIKADNDFLAKSSKIRKMTLNILPAMDSERCRRNDKDSSSRSDTGLATFDIKELLCSKVSTEACLCDCILTVGHRHLCSKDGVAAMCDICERAAMYESSSPLSCLHEIRMYGIHQKNSDSPGNTKVPHCERSVIIFYTEDNILYAMTEVIE